MSFPRHYILFREYGRGIKCFDLVGPKKSGIRPHLFGGPREHHDDKFRVVLMGQGPHFKQQLFRYFSFVPRPFILPGLEPVVHRRQELRESKIFPECDPGPPDRRMLHERTLLIQAAIGNGSVPPFRKFGQVLQPKDGSDVAVLMENIEPVKNDKGFSPRLKSRRRQSND